MVDFGVALPEGDRLVCPPKRVAPRAARDPQPSSKAGLQRVGIAGPSPSEQGLHIKLCGLGELPNQLQEVSRDATPRLRREDLIVETNPHEGRLRGRLKSANRIGFVVHIVLG